MGRQAKELGPLAGGKRRDMGLGGFPDVSLAGAREAAREARAKVRDGVDPIVAAVSPGRAQFDALLSPSGRRLLASAVSEIWGACIGVLQAQRMSVHLQRPAIAQPLQPLASLSPLRNGVE